MKYITKKDTLNFRLSQTDKKKLEDVAKHHLLSMSEVILLLVNREYEKIKGVI